MLTASEGSEKPRAIEAGADDFIPKPFDRAELLARVRSLLRMKRYHDTIEPQAAELRELNRTLEERVRTQVERAPAVAAPAAVPLAPAGRRARLVGRRADLRSHRRQLAMLFVDLRGWTSFVDAVEPEELMRVLHEFHRRRSAVLSGDPKRPSASSRETASSSSSTTRSSPGRAAAGDPVRCRSAKRWPS